MGRLGVLVAGVLAVNAVTTTTKAPPGAAASPFNIQTCTALVSSVTYRSLANEYAVACAEDVPEVKADQSNQALTRLGKSPMTSATISKMLSSNACRMWYGNLAVSIITMSPPCTYMDAWTGQLTATSAFATTMTTYVTIANDKATQNAGNRTLQTDAPPPSITFPPPVDSSARLVGVALTFVALAIGAAIM